MTRFARLRAALAFTLLGATLALAGPQLAPQTARAAGDLSTSPLRGHWKNIDPHTHDIPYLRIGVIGGALRLDIWGVCHPTTCYWGPQTLTAGNGLTNGGATYHFGYADRIVKMFVRRDTLQVQTHTHYTDGSGRADYERYDTFERSTPALWQS
jgi:hypothetical protein